MNCDGDVKMFKEHGGERVRKLMMTLKWMNLKSDCDRQVECEIKK